MDAIWLFSALTSPCLPLHGYLPTPTLPPYKSASGIGYISKKIFKMAGNSASYPLYRDYK